MNNEIKKRYDEYYNSDEVQDWMNAPLGKPKVKTQTDEIGQVDTFVMRFLGVTDIEYDFDENKQGDVDKLEKYFNMKRKEFVLRSILKHKISVGGYMVFSETDQKSGVWHIKLDEICYFLDTEDKMIDEKILKISVFLDDWYFD